MTPEPIDPDIFTRVTLDKHQENVCRIEFTFVDRHHTCEIRRGMNAMEVVGELMTLANRIKNDEGITHYKYNTTVARFRATPLQQVIELQQCETLEEAYEVFERWYGSNIIPTEMWEDVWKLAKQ